MNTSPGKLGIVRQVPHDAGHDDRRFANPASGNIPFAPSNHMGIFPIALPEPKYYRAALRRTADSLAKTVEGFRRLAETDDLKEVRTDAFTGSGNWRLPADTVI